MKYISLLHWTSVTVENSKVEFEFRKMLLYVKYGFVVIASESFVVGNRYDVLGKSCYLLSVSVVSLSRGIRWYGFCCVIR